MIKAVIVDDEPYSCETLVTLLARYCPTVKVADICYSGKDALSAIKEQQPQIVFLDIEMPRMNGFEMLEKIPEINFEIIFTTSYDQYAIKAIRFSALDYLLKPVDREELQRAVQKVITAIAPSASPATGNTFAKTASTCFSYSENCSANYGRIADDCFKCYYQLRIGQQLHCFPSKG